MRDLRNVGAHIRKARIERGLTISSLAKAIGTSSAYISAVELGKKNISRTQLEKIEDALGLQRDYLWHESVGGEVTISSQKDGIQPSSIYHINDVMLHAISLLPYSNYDFDDNMSAEKAQWEAINPEERLEHVVQETNFTDALREWKGIYDVLRNMQIKQRLDSALLRFIQKRHESCEFAGTSNEEVLAFDTEGRDSFSVAVRNIRLTAKDTKWRFIYPFVDNTIAEEQVETLLRRICGDSEERVSIVFTDKSIFDMFKQCAVDIAAEVDTLSPYDTPCVFDAWMLVLVDTKTWSVSDTQALDTKSLLYYA